MPKFGILVGLLGAMGTLIGATLLCIPRPAAPPPTPTPTSRLPATGERLIFGTDTGDLWVIPLNGQPLLWQPTIEMPTALPTLPAMAHTFAFRDHFYALTTNGSYTAYTYPPAVWSAPWNRYPKFSSRGDRVALTTRNSDELHLMALEDQSTRLLVSLPSITGVQWSPDDRLLIIETMEGTDLTAATFTYYRVNADGSNLAPLFTIDKGQSVLSSLHIAADNRRALYVQNTGNPALPRDLYSLDLDTGQATAIYRHADPASFIGDARLSPDGEHIAFTVVGADAWAMPGALWMVNANGNGATPLYELPPFGDKQDWFGRYRGYRGVTDFLWSPDSQQIAFTVSQQGDCSGSAWNEGGVLAVTCHQRLFLIERDGRNPRQLTNGVPFSDDKPIRPLFWLPAPSNEG